MADINDNIHHQISSLEQAAQVLMAPPNVVTHEQRQSAEKLFHEFRATKFPYELCRYILESCRCDYVQFQAASTLREAVLREWNALDNDTPQTLLSYLLQYTTQHANLQNFVREQLLYVVAVIVKRGRLTTEKPLRDQLYQQLAQLVSGSDIRMQLMAASLMSALINEYSTTSRSSDMGLPWEFHNKCKRAFQEEELKTIFELIVLVLSRSNMAATNATDATIIYQRYLQLAEEILNWEFVPCFAVRRNVGTFGRAQNVTLRPTDSWREIILKPEVLDVFFKLHPIIRQNPDLAHHCTQCISQLASINGRVFPDDESVTRYLGNYLERFLELMTRIEIFDYEAFAVSNAVNSLVILFPLSSFQALDAPLLASFVKWLAETTCGFCRSAANEETLHKDDRIYMEAYEKLLDSWTTMLGDEDFCRPGLLRNETVAMVDSYVKCHIGPPDGVRNQRVDGEEELDEGEYVEDDGDDRDQFNDQLSAIGMFCRHVPDYSLPLLSRLLEQKCALYKDTLSTLQSRGHSEGFSLEKFHSLHEDIHWLVLIAGHALAEDTESEVATIPTEIMNYSSDQATTIDAGLTTQLLVSAGGEGPPPGVDLDSSKIDQTVRLTAAVFSLCQACRRALQANMTRVLSPQVGSTLTWFLQRWARTYLLPPENHYSKLSTTISYLYGVETEGSEWSVDFILEQIVSIFTLWSGETNLCRDAAGLLVSLLENKWKAHVVVKSDKILHLADLHAQNRPPISDLAPRVRRQLTRALVLGACAVLNDEQRKQMLQQKVLLSHHERFQAMAVRPDLNKVYQNNDVKGQVANVLESSCGVVEASTCSNYATVFDFILPILNDSIGVVDLYHQHEEIVQLVLDLYVEVANRQLCYLATDRCKLFYDCVVKLVQVYAKHNKGVKRGVVEEEDQLLDVALIIELLTHVMSREFLNLTTDVPDSAECDSGSVTLFGISQIMPLLSADMLEFPSVCSQYYKLLSFIAEIAPQKLCQLPPDLFNFLMVSIQSGLTRHGPDISKLCLDFLMGLGSHAIQHPEDGVKIQEALGFFLQAVLTFILTERFDMDLVDCASSAFYMLICSNKERYRDLVHEILQRQSDETMRLRLVESFNKLTPENLTLDTKRTNRLRFMTLFDQFFIDVRGILCVR